VDRLGGAGVSTGGRQVGIPGGGGRASAYVRLADAPDADLAPGAFDWLRSIVAGEPSILEIKRPRRPTYT
jgi:hypothetical protein